VGLIAAILTWDAQKSAPDVVVTIDRNASTVRANFTFARVPPPRKDDAAAKATLALVHGAQDPNGAALAALVDGALPANEDQPDANFFFNAGTTGGTFRMDLGAPIEVAQVNTYSWHPNTRGPQVYMLYASDPSTALGAGGTPTFALAPKVDVDPADVGWTWIATVDTRIGQPDPGGQYGVSIAKKSGVLGTFRYLLFVCYATEGDDAFGNTFYSEIDVIAKPAR
jgi:hypothetical protein